MASAPPRYSFVVPIYNDASAARDFCVEFARVMSAHPGVRELASDVELIFVDDGSAGDSAARLAAVTREFPFVRVAVLSRNFGQHIALSCGYRLARGAFVGMLNVDMEDPPDQIPLVLAKVEEGTADIVLGVRPRREGPWSDRATSLAFNWLLNRLTGAESPVNAATLRVMNRQFVDAYNSLAERSRYIPGLEIWLGFRHAYVPVRHQPRRTGRSSYSLRRRFRMAFDAIVSFSDLPLKWVAFFGFGVAALGFVLTAALIVEKLWFVDLRPGYTSTVAITVFLGGVEIFVTGLGCIYIGRVLREVQGRPLYVIRELVNFPDGPRREGGGA